jgi:hypothetical protein
MAGAAQQEISDETHVHWLIAAATLGVAAGEITLAADMPLKAPPRCRARCFASSMIEVLDL